ncbi:MAG: hypothetical protein V4689_15100 [Verrucomicrobiota bacterium]
MRLSPLWLAGVLAFRFALSASAQSAPEQLCGRDILTTGDAWENVQVERYEFERMLASGSLVRWPQRMAALVSHLRFMERRALLPQTQRDRIAVGTQLVAGRTLPSNQFALSGDAAGLRAELSQIEAGTALVGQQFPAEQLKPLIPLTHLLAPIPSQLRATLVKAPVAVTGEPLNVTFTLAKDSGGTAQISGCHAFLVAADGSDFHHVTAQATGQPGKLTAAFTPRQGGPHRLWIAATLEQTGREELLSMDLTPPAVAPPDTAKESLIITRAAFKAELRFVGGPPRAGEIAVARLILTRPDGQPMKPLEPVFGGPAYLIAFSNAAREAIPIRPTGPAANPELLGSVEIDFRFRPVAAGTCHLFAEVRVNATDGTLAFSFPVRPAR